MRKFTIAASGLLAALALATACGVGNEPVAVQPAQETGGPGKTAKAKPPIELAAKRTSAKPSVLSEGAPLTCVRVTVVNRTSKNVDINPLYFAITGTDGVKHDASTALGEYEGQIETMDIAPGERARGVVCVRGKLTPATVSMTDAALSTAARAQVAE